MTGRAEQRRLAAILATDVVGYSRLMAIDEEGTLRLLRLLRAEIIDPAIEEHRGRIVKLMGDGSLVEFGSVVDAIRCAIDIQQSVAKRNADAPEGQRLDLRIGINLGDVIVDGDDIYGDGVNVAARLEGLAEPGAIIASGTVFDYARGKVQVEFDDLGLLQVKNLPEPVRGYRVGWEGAATTTAKASSIRRKGWSGRSLAAAVVAILVVIGAGALWFVKETPPPPGKPSIAVLPFDNVGGGEDIDRLADGMTEDVITDLSRFEEFEVIARNSTEVYQGQAVDIREVAEDLGVNYVLEGSIQRDAERIRVTAQLIYARDGTHSWAERWDRPASDFFAVQSEIAERVASRLGGPSGIVNVAEARANRRARPDDLSVYELYLRSQQVIATNPQENVDEAIRLLRRAVEADPGFAMGWTALAGAYLRLYSFDYGNVSARETALDAVQRAIDLDPLDADSHAILAEILAFQDQPARAKAEFDIALDLNPGAVDNVLNAASWFAYLGDAERGAELADRVRRLDPHGPSLRFHRLAAAYFFARRFDDALEMAQKQPAEERNQWAWIRLAATYAALGREKEAEAAVEETLEHYPDTTIQGFAGGPGWGEDRQVVIEYMRKAGFPTCASDDDLAKAEDAHPFPECQT